MPPDREAPPTETIAPAETLEQKILRLEAENGELKQKLEVSEAARVAAEAISKTDTLTGLPNRLASDEALGREVATVKRGIGKAVILFIDVDFFKQVNDKWTHAQGDNVLRAIADMLASLGRESDFFGRYAGDEFVGVLKIGDDVTLEAVQEGLKKFNEGARQINRTGKDEQFEPQTLSIGGVIIDESIDQEVSWEKIRNAADVNLDYSKKTGKDRATLTRFGEELILPESEPTEVVVE